MLIGSQNAALSASFIKGSLIMKNGFSALITPVAAILITVSMPVFYNWNLLYGVVGLVPWLILALLIILIKENRKPQVLLITIPLLVAALLWLAFKAIFPISSAQIYLLDISFACLTVAMSALMLLAHKRAGCNRFLTFLWAVAVSVLIGAATYLSYSGLAFNQETTILIVLYAIGILAVLVGLVFAAHCCRKYYSPIRFTISLAFCTPAGAILAMLVYAAIAISIMAVTHGLPSRWYWRLIDALTFGLVFGGILYAIELPFIILTLNCSFFRKRFHECFRLKGMDFEREKVPAPEHIMLTKAPEKKENTEDKVSNRWMNPPRPSD